MWSTPHGCAASAAPSSTGTSGTGPTSRGARSRGGRATRTPRSSRRCARSRRRWHVCSRSTGAGWRRCRPSPTRRPPRAPRCSRCGATPATPGGRWRSARRREPRAHAGGELPREEAALRALPGVGPFTAAVVRCFGHGEEVAAVDVNVARVLGRAVLGELDPTPAGRRAAIEDVARRMLPPGDARRWNPALMDLGAFACRSRPRCDRCPLERLCAARPRFARGEKAPRPPAPAGLRGVGSPVAGSHPADPARGGGRGGIGRRRGAAGAGRGGPRRAGASPPAAGGARAGGAGVAGRQPLRAGRAAGSGDGRSGG